MKLIPKKNDYTPKFNSEGKPILNPSNSQDVRWLHEQQANRGKQYYKQGMKEAEPIAKGMALLTAAPAITGAGISSFIEPLDIASVALNPSDWTNWIPFGLHAASKADRFTPTRIRRGVYNNVMPGSYKESYAGGKRKEIANAAKDIISGNTTYENPKWREWMSLPYVYSEFGWSDDAKLAERFREEAWKKSLGIPHKDEYLIRTGKKDSKGHDIVHYNLDKIPLKHLQRFIDATMRRKHNPIADYLGNTGGWMSSNKSGDVFTMRDLWDILPLQNPNREGLIPKKIKPLFAKKIDTPNSMYPFKWEYRKWVPEWFKELDPTAIVGKGPFMNITSVKAKPISKKQTYSIESVNDVRNRIKGEEYDINTEFIDYEDTPEAIELQLKDAKDFTERMVNKIPMEQILKHRDTKPYSKDELLKKYGLHYIKK